MKVIKYIGMSVSFSVFLMASSGISLQVEENGAYKPTRIKKAFQQDKDIQGKKIKKTDRNVVDRGKYLEVKNKEEKFKKELKKIEEKKKIKFVDATKENVEEKEKKIKEEKEKVEFKPLQYIKQDTPMQRIATYYEKDRASLYKHLVEYLVNDKQVGDLDDIAKVLNSQDDYLSFYEAVVKTFYQGYFEGEYNKYLLTNMNLLYNKSFDRIQDTYIGLLLQDLFLSMGIIHPENPLITSVGYCFTLGEEMRIFSCKMNQIKIICLSGDEQKCNYYKAKAKYWSKESERYLNEKMDLLSEVNKEKKKQFELENQKK